MEEKIYVDTVNGNYTHKVKEVQNYVINLDKCNLTITPSILNIQTISVYYDLARFNVEFNIGNLTPGCYNITISNIENDNYTEYFGQKTLTIEENEVENYIVNLQDILNFANIVNKAPVEGLNTSVGSLDNFNVFRKDEVKVFEDNKALLENAPEEEDNMFRIPKVI